MSHTRYCSIHELSPDRDRDPDHDLASDHDPDLDNDPDPDHDHDLTLDPDRDRDRDSDRDHDLALDPNLDRDRHDRSCPVRATAAFMSLLLLMRISTWPATQTGTKIQSATRTSTTPLTPILTLSCLQNRRTMSLKSATPRRVPHALLQHS